MASENILLSLRERGARRVQNQLNKTGNAISKFGSRSRRSSRQMRTLGSASKATSQSVSHLRGVLTGAGLSFGGLALGVRHVVLAYEEQRKITAQTGAVIKATGGAANVTKRQVEGLANSLSRKSAIDDEQIQQGLNMMLSFRQVRNEAGKSNDVFNQAGQAAVDMSAFFIASGKDMDVATASMSIGKALNDPTKGITRLTRQGVTFNKQQQDQIKTMQESGDMLGAQKVIIRELNHEFGGTAAATATPLGRMKVAVDNVSEAIGRGLSPATDAASVALSKLAERAEPKLIALGDRLKKLFGRRDLTVEQKITLGARDAKRTFAPFEREVERWVRSLQLGDRFLRWFDAALPKMAEAAGRGAGRIGIAFVKGFAAADVTGKLFVGSIILGRLGVFGWAGRKAGEKFVAWARPMGEKFMAMLGRGLKAGFSHVGNALKALPAMLGKNGGIFGKILSKAGPIAAKIGPKGLKALGPLGAILSFGLDTEDAGIKPGQEETLLRQAERRRRGAAGRGQARARARRLRQEQHPASRAPNRVRPAAHAGRSRQPIVVHSEVKLHNKTIGKAVARYNEDVKARR